MIIAARPDWHRDAACKGVEISVFFGKLDPKSGIYRRNDAKAKQICQGCEVIIQCAAMVKANPQLLGVWAATTEKERQYKRRRAS